MGPSEEDLTTVCSVASSGFTVAVKVMDKWGDNQWQNKINYHSKVKFYHKMIIIK